MFNVISLMNHMGPLPVSANHSTNVGWSKILLLSIYLSVSIFLCMYIMYVSIYPSMFNVHGLEQSLKTSQSHTHPSPSSGPPSSLSISLSLSLCRYLSLSIFDPSPLLPLFKHYNSLSFISFPFYLIFFLFSILNFYPIPSSFNRNCICRIPLTFPPI